MTVTITRWQEAHGDGVRQLISPIQRAEFNIPITLADQPDLYDVPGFYRKGFGDFWVALDEVDGAVVGSIALIDIGNQQSALRKMFVRADRRGREHGVAAQLLAGLVAHARASKVEQIFLGTTSAFLAAHRFYEKAGFVRVEVADLPAAFPRIAVDTVFYRLDL